MNLFLNLISFDRRISFLTMGVACAGLGLLQPLAATGPQDPGEVVYEAKCVQCHGKRGEGVKDKYDEPLHGNRTVEALAKRIARTMPDDDVGSCVGEDAKQVAAYIYDAFYSPQAFARLHVPEFDLVRLTNSQYRASVADIVGRFRPGFDRPLGNDRGLKAHYSGVIVEPPAPAPAPEVAPATPPPPADKTAVAKKDDKKKDKKDDKKKEKDLPKVRFDRTDAQVDFAFGEASPDPEKMGPNKFSVRWEGSVIADDTGTYEFIIKSENGVRLFVNDNKAVLIDGSVASGPDVRVLKKSVYLLGGRAYPISLEFFKTEEKTASIHLDWKPPYGIESPIPQRNLSPMQLRQTVVVSTIFPPDDRSSGYERGTGISKAWDQATTEAALDAAENVDQHLEELSGSKVGAADRADKLKLFARRFAEAAFRRPLSDQDYQRYVEKQFKGAKTPELGVKRVVLFALKSPRFLYPDLPDTGAPDGYDVATRLALNLWDSIPDTQLLQAAAANKLQTREQIAAQATRMIADQRTNVKLHGFFYHWLELERAETISKDAKVFPEFDAAALADLRRSLWLFLDQVVWSDRSDYRELLQANYLLLNDHLAKLYGKSVTGTGFQKVDFDPQQRAGVVTHPFLLAAFASSKQTSPIHRGVFLTRNIVGMTLKPPPMAVAFEDAKFDLHLTMREKITELTKNNSCMGCHKTINPLGFTLENYDAIGRWRTKENNRPVDSVTDFSTDEGQTIRLHGARDLVKFAVENPDGHRAFIHQLFEHMAKQSLNVYGPDTLEDLRKSFITSNFNIRQLLGNIAVIASCRGMPETAAR